MKTKTAPVVDNKEFILMMTEEKLTSIIQSAVKDALKEVGPVSSETGSDIMTLNDVIALTGYKKDSIYGFTATESIPFIKKGKKLFFSRKAIEKWITDGNH
jgi:predicted DNA-binding transcriptional regulator AlpA